MWYKTASGRNYDMTEVTIDVLPGSAFELALRVLRTAVKEDGRSVHVEIEGIGYLVQPRELTQRFYISPPPDVSEPIRCAKCGRETVWCDMCGTQQMSDRSEGRR